MASHPLALFFADFMFLPKQSPMSKLCPSSNKLESGVYPRTGHESCRSESDLAFVVLLLVKGVVTIKICSPLVDLFLQALGKNLHCRFGLP